MANNQAHQYQGILTLILALLWLPQPHRPIQSPNAIQPSAESTEIAV